MTEGERNRAINRASARLGDGPRGRAVLAFLLDVVHLRGAAAAAPGCPQSFAKPAHLQDYAAGDAAEVRLQLDLARVDYLALATPESVTFLTAGPIRVRTPACQRYQQTTYMAAFDEAVALVGGGASASFSEGWADLAARLAADRYGIDARSAFLTRWEPPA